MQQRKTIRLHRRVTLALVMIGVVSAVIVGAVSPVVVTVRMRRVAREALEAEYADAIVAYMTLYGTWENGELTEPLPLFVARQTAPVDGVPAPNGSRANGIPSPVAVPADGSIDHLLFIDVDGTLRSAPPDYAGQIPRNYRRADNAVMMNGVTIGWVFPLDTPPLTEQAREYIRSIVLVLIPSLVGICVVAVIVGYFLGRQLTGALRHLTRRIANVKPGEKVEPLAVETNDEVGELARAFNTMIDEIDRSHRTLTELSTVDELTGISNRRYFRQEAERLTGISRRFGHPLSLMMGDLDFFKKVNDTFGHSCGDQVLKVTSATIVEMSREVDVVARWGGEEFVVLLPGTDIAGAVTSCERIRCAIEDKDWGRIAPNLHVTMSIGVARFQEGDSLDTLVARADEMLYEAKNSGRNRVVSGS